MKFKKAFIVFFVLFAAVFAVVFELGKNTVPGWCLAGALFALFFVLHGKALSKKKWFIRLLSWALFFVMIGCVFQLSAPAEKQIPAVDVASPQATDVVEVQQGQLTGVYTEDKAVAVYAGIPYAKPPVGELRWTAPQTAEPWDGVRACDTFAPMSMQQRNNTIVETLTQLIGFHRFAITPKDNYLGAMSEDSLYLNIWQPANVTENTPVLFFIHGGSLTGGQTWYSEYNGETLASQGIIVVNCAYRLGVFGYYANEALAAEDPNGTTGNYGLLDQIKALEWVHENIAAFGGDPENITIAGESAGSSSVNAICVSPLAKGLFRRAIAESSGILAKQPYHTFRSMNSALKMGKDIMEEFDAANIDDLRAVPAEKLVKTRFTNSAMTVDGYAITEQPYLTYEQGRNNEEALLNGFNKHEADFFTFTTKATADNYEKLLSNVVGDHAAEVAALYPPKAQDKAYSLALVEAGGDAKGSFNQVYSAAWFTYSHKLWSDYDAAEGKDVYLYYFTKDNGSLGSGHAGELPYAYGNLHRHANLYDDSDMALSEMMQQYWLNFVKTGDPNGEGLPVWKTYNDDSEKVLEFGETVQLVSAPFLDLYPILDSYQNEQLLRLAAEAK